MLSIIVFYLLEINKSFHIRICFEGNIDTTIRLELNTLPPFVSKIKYFQQQPRNARLNTQKYFLTVISSFLLNKLQDQRLVQNLPRGIHDENGV